MCGHTEEFFGKRSSELIETVEDDLFLSLPNPLSQNVVIRAYIPEGSTNPNLVIYDMLGRRVQSHKLTTGSNQVTLSDLPKGLNIGIVLVDGKSVERRKIVVQ